MKLAVSNIAWLPENRINAYHTLRTHGFTGLEIAPGLFFHSSDNPFNPSDNEANKSLAEISDSGLSLISMQSLLFSTEGAALFEGEAPLRKFKQGMKQAIELAGRFHIPNLVFGSPRQRIIPEGMKYSEAEKFAASIFRELGDLAISCNAVIAIESNPSSYGTNFINTVEQAGSFVTLADHPAITLNLDIGAIYMNNQFDIIESLIEEAVPLTSHVHISEPDLAPAPADIDQAVRVLRALNEAGYEKWISIEMKRDPENKQETLQTCTARLLEAAAQASEPS